MFLKAIFILLALTSTFQLALGGFRNNFSWDVYELSPHYGWNSASLERDAVDSVPISLDYRDVSPDVNTQLIYDVKRASHVVSLTMDDEVDGVWCLPTALVIMVQANATKHWAEGTILVGGPEWGCLDQETHTPGPFYRKVVSQAQLNSTFWRIETVDSSFVECFESGHIEYAAVHPKATFINGTGKYSDARLNARGFLDDLWDVITGNIDGKFSSRYTLSFNYDTEAQGKKDTLTIAEGDNYGLYCVECFAYIDVEVMAVLDIDHFQLKKFEVRVGGRVYAKAVIQASASLAHTFETGDIDLVNIPIIGASLFDVAGISIKLGLTLPITFSASLEVSGAMKAVVGASFSASFETGMVCESLGSCRKIETANSFDHQAVGPYLDAQYDIIGKVSLGVGLEASLSSIASAALMLRPYIKLELSNTAEGCSGLDKLHYQLAAGIPSPTFEVDVDISIDKLDIHLASFSKQWALTNLHKEWDLLEGCVDIFKTLGVPSLTLSYPAVWPDYPVGEAIPFSTAYRGGFTETDDTSFTVTFGDGSDPVVVSSGSDFSHVFSLPGDYVIQLISNLGNFGSFVHTVSSYVEDTRLLSYVTASSAPTFIASSEAFTPTPFNDGAAFLRFQFVIPADELNDAQIDVSEPVVGLGLHFLGYTLSTRYNVTLGVGWVANTSYAEPSFFPTKILWGSSYTTDLGALTSVLAGKETAQLGFRFLDVLNGQSFFIRPNPTASLVVEVRQAATDTVRAAANATNIFWSHVLRKGSALMEYSTTGGQPERRLIDYAIPDIAIKKCLKGFFSVDCQNFVEPVGNLSMSLRLRDSHNLTFSGSLLAGNSTSYSVALTFPNGTVVTSPFLTGSLPVDSLGDNGQDNVTVTVTNSGSTVSTVSIVSVESDSSFFTPIRILILLGVAAVAILVLLCCKKKRKSSNSMGKYSASRPAPVAKGHVRKMTQKCENRDKELSQMKTKGRV